MLVPTGLDPRRELTEAGFFDRLEEARRSFQAAARGTTSRGQNYGFGAIDVEACVALYALVRTRRPEIAVETGVCNGVSTYVLLQAMAVNGTGRLWSIDLPEHTGTEYPSGTFWEGKGGACVPKGRPSGWFVPAELHGRWVLRLGSSRDLLPPLLEEVGEIDLFLHDSEHSYECMTFEYEQAWPRLRPGGVLASDDVRWNSAFADFAARVGREERVLTPAVAYLER